MRRRRPPQLDACGRCGRVECEAVDAEQCAAWAQLAEQRQRFETVTTPKESR